MLGTTRISEFETLRGFFFIEASPPVSTLPVFSPGLSSTFQDASTSSNVFRELWHNNRDYRAIVC